MFAYCLKVLVEVGLDIGSIQVGDLEGFYYQKLQTCSKILAIPHILYDMDVIARVRNDIIINNIEA